MKPEPNEGEMGDTVRFNSPDNHYHYDPNNPPTMPTPIPTTQSKGIGTLAKLAIGAGLLGTGIGAGVGIPLLIDALSDTVTVEMKLETMDWRLGQPIVE